MLSPNSKNKSKQREKENALKSFLNTASTTTLTHRPTTPFSGTLDTISMRTLNERWWTAGSITSTSLVVATRGLYQWELLLLFYTVRSLPNRSYIVYISSKTDNPATNSNQTENRGQGSSRAFFMILWSFELMVLRAHDPSWCNGVYTHEKYLDLFVTMLQVIFTFVENSYSTIFLASNRSKWIVISCFE